MIHPEAKNCPICGEPSIDRCRCPRADSECKNGHKWHWCIVHLKIVIGHFDHSLSINICTCVKDISNSLSSELIAEAVLGDVTCRCFPDDQHECKPCLLIRLIDEYVLQRINESYDIITNKVKKCLEEIT